MLKKEELLDALKLGQSVGLRRVGHFNHDAYLSVGPHDAGEKPLKADASKQKDSRRKRAALTCVVDPQTGDIYYRRSQ